MIDKTVANCSEAVSSVFDGATVMFGGFGSVGVPANFEGLLLRELVRGLEPAAVQARTGAPLRVAADCREKDVPAVLNGVQLSS